MAAILPYHVSGYWVGGTAGAAGIPATGSGAFIASGFLGAEPVKSGSVDTLFPIMEEGRGCTAPADTVSTGAMNPVFVSIPEGGAIPLGSVPVAVPLAFAAGMVVGSPVFWSVLIAMV